MRAATPGEHIERELRGLAPSVEIHFERLSVTMAQIAALGLPTRPTKGADTLRREVRGRTPGTAAVELDAIHPDTLRPLVRDAIEQHIDFRQLEVFRIAEQEERKILKTFRRE